MKLSLSLSVAAAGGRREDNALVRRMNVWYRTRDRATHEAGLAEAPAILEEHLTMEDAVFSAPPN